MVEHSESEKREMFAKGFDQAVTFCALALATSGEPEWADYLLRNMARARENYLKLEFKDA